MAVHPDYRRRPAFAAVAVIAAPAAVATIRSRLEIMLIPPVCFISRTLAGKVMVRIAPVVGYHALYPAGTGRTPLGISGSPFCPVVQSWSRPRKIDDECPIVRQQLRKHQAAYDIADRLAKRGPTPVPQLMAHGYYSLSDSIGLQKCNLG